MPDSKALYNEYQTQMAALADVRFATAVLQWDQETYLPPKGAHFRGRQITTLSEIAHRMATSDSLGSLLQELLGKDGLAPDEQKNIARSWEDYSRQKKYPAAFVTALSDATNAAFFAWMEARKANCFLLFEKELATLITLKREETHLLGWQGHPYDALLDEYERGATVALLDSTFDALLPTLSQLLNSIAQKPQVEAAFLQQHYPKQQQWEWSLWLLGRLHFDMERGRQDVSEHPFSVAFNPDDVRITTRIDENDVANATWSTIHELGHALYEQGLPQNAYGLPGGEACSYSIHESQSRFWENNVGRSRPFWDHYLPHLKTFFPEQLAGIDAAHFFKGINKVQPSLIRTEADEITYHFHVAIRYGLEKKLIEGSLATADIPHLWNEQYKKQLGVTVPDDKRGCLQDVHWSHGSFGYFPTYSLGSFYAAQFFEAAGGSKPLLNAALGAGRTDGLLDWLRTHIHRKGRLHTSEQLCAAVTGKPLDVRIFTNYLLEKYKVIYNL